MATRSMPRAAVAAVLLAATVAACSSRPISQAVEESPAGSAAVASTTPAGSAAPGPPAGESAAPAASLTPVPASGPPAKPGDPTFKLVGETANASGGYTDTYRITWSAPANAADRFLVYGLPECLRTAKQDNGKPCVVRGMKIPTDHLKLLATVPGDQREATISWDLTEAGLAPYAAVLMRAVNSAGNSIFTIVHSENVCVGCVS